MLIQYPCPLYDQVNCCTAVSGFPFFLKKKVKENSFKLGSSNEIVNVTSPKRGNRHTIYAPRKHVLPGIHQKSFFILFVIKKNNNNNNNNNKNNKFTILVSIFLQ